MVYALDFNNCVIKRFCVLCFIEIPVINANYVDSDQMLQNTASEQSLRCLEWPFYRIQGLNGLKHQTHLHSRPSEIFFSPPAEGSSGAYSILP